MVLYVISSFSVLHLRHVYAIRHWFDATTDGVEGWNEEMLSDHFSPIRFPLFEYFPRKVFASKQFSFWVVTRIIFARQSVKTIGIPQSVDTKAKVPSRCLRAQKKSEKIAKRKLERFFLFSNSFDKSETHPLQICNFDLKFLDTREVAAIGRKTKLKLRTNLWSPHKRHRHAQTKASLWAPHSSLLLSPYFLPSQAEESRGSLR